MGVKYRKLIFYFNLINKFVTMQDNSNMQKISMKNNVDPTPNVMVFEDNSRLDIIHYVEATSKNFKEIEQYSKEKIINDYYSRSIIFSTEQKKIDVQCPSLPFMIETDQTNFDFDFQNIEKCFMFPEGTTVRVYFYKKWLISTNKKIDAGQSIWSANKSFYDLFVQMLEKIDLDFEKLTATLDKQKCYFFVISSSEESQDQMTVLNKQSQLFFIGTTNKAIETINFDESIANIQKLPVISNPTDLDTMKKIINNSYENYMFSSILVVLKNQLWVKFYHDNYFFYFQTRNKARNVDSAYIHMLFDKSDEARGKKLDFFSKFYGNLRFLNINIAYTDVINLLVDEYIGRFIKRIRKTLYSQYHWIIESVNKTNPPKNARRDTIELCVLRFLETIDFVSRKNLIYHRIKEIEAQKNEQQTIQVPTGGAFTINDLSEFPNLN